MKGTSSPISHIPAMLPDQTLYSWCMMFHALSGNISEDETRLQLFGSIKAGRHFHIPSHLDAFCARTQSVLGSPEQIIAARTVIPYFTRFRPISVARDTLAKLRGNNAAGTSQELGMWNVGPHGALLCRVCPDCMREDESDFNFSYWHRLHQLPGVLVCQKHGTLLVVAPVDTGHRFHSRSIIPSNFRDGISLVMKVPSNAAHATLFRLAILAEQLVGSEFIGGYDQNRMRRSCHNALRNRFSPDSTGKFDPLEAAADYNLHFHDVLDVPELRGAITERGIHALWHILENKDSRTHPLEWVLIVDWLFGEWTEFSGIFQANVDL